MEKKLFSLTVPNGSSLANSFGFLFPGFEISVIFLPLSFQMMVN